MKEITFYIQFEDGSRWIPDTQKIRDSYRAHYVNRGDFEEDELDDANQLRDWMENNMRWEDLGAVMSKEPDPTCYADEWATFSCTTGRTIT